MKRRYARGNASREVGADGVHDVSGGRAKVARPPDLRLPWMFYVRRAAASYLPRRGPV